MTDIRIDAADALKIAGLHQQAAEDLDGTSTSAPGTVNGGVAGPALLGIMERIVGDAADLARINQACDELMRQVADNYNLTEESVRTQFAGLVKGLPPRYSK